ncbi:DeoR/GlpR transcriptional regulator [Azoarcus sp. L1K30]|uniref:DeoR/GlpR family DNA-binding transcription regulator n=1 Tax=Azoarcus sp. L1K30 TaxID=2820277 RepID=UPI001B837DFC|nr:DeoR/GlpR family DNA-binding transcription regulator [Azoarcus sp. L1K30]MBR0568492.1 DeoR/GlpR transcriptional regulator [Azoarcus sp. L1K30]
MNIRQEKIVEILHGTSTLSILELARSLNVSDETIRRDLRRLADEGLIERFHGGARLSAENTEAPFKQRLRTRAPAKHAIACACAELIPEDCTMFLDNSSTACFLARQLARRKGLTIVTPSIQVARLLAERGNGNRIIIPGGELRTSDMTMVGASAISYAAQFSPALLVLSVAAVTTAGCMDFDLYEAEFKRALIPHAAQVVLLADAGKFEGSGLVRTCGLDAIDILVTDAQPPETLAQAFAPRTRVIVAGVDHD